MEIFKATYNFQMIWDLELLLFSRKMILKHAYFHLCQKWTKICQMGRISNGSKILTVGPIVVKFWLLEYFIRYFNICENQENWRHQLPGCGLNGSFLQTMTLKLGRRSA